MHKNVKGMNLSIVNGAYFQNFELYRIFHFLCGLQYKEFQFYMLAGYIIDYTFGFFWNL
jgi:hypothetical protein